MSDFVLVQLDNGQVASVPAALARRRKLKTVDGDAVDASGRPVKPTRGNGRPAKPKTSVAKAAEQKAVTPTEGAADSTLTDSKE